MEQLITNEEFTEVSTSQDGTFDALMRAALEHIRVEYQAGRITGDQYAQVYLGTMTAAFQNTTQFLLGQLNADVQRQAILAQTAATSAQKLKTDAEKELVIAQTVKTEAEKLVVDETLFKVIAERQLLTKQLEKMQIEMDKMTAEKLLIAEQTTKTVADTAYVTAGLDKISAEVDVLAQRKVTEEAQTSDVAGGATVEGVIGKQKSLYEAQTNGFARDAEHKLSQLMVKSYEIQRMTDEGFSTAGTGLENAEIQKVLNKAKSGIGVA